MKLDTETKNGIKKGCEILKKTIEIFNNQSKTFPIEIIQALDALHLQNILRNKDVIRSGKQTTFEHVFQNVKQSRVIEWKKKSAIEVYNVGTGESSFYANLARPNLVKIVSEVMPQPGLLISLGGGDGSELKLFCEKNPNLKAIFMDINQNNISLAQKNLKAYAQNITFLQGDISTADTIEKKIFSQMQTSLVTQTNRDTVVTFCGVLARQVLNGTYTAVKILQKMQAMVDLIAVNSWSAPLFNNRILKALGYTVINNKKQFTTKNHQPVLLLRQQTYEERLEFLLKHCNKNHHDNKTINLNMSSTPLADLLMLKMHYPKIYKNHVVLDLSWANIKDYEIEKLVKQHFPEMKSLKRIILSGHEPWFNAVKKIMPKNLEIVLRHDNADISSEVSFFSTKVLKELSENSQSQEASQMLRLTPSK